MMTSSSARVPNGSQGSDDANGSQGTRTRPSREGALPNYRDHSDSPLNGSRSSSPLSSVSPAPRPLTDGGQDGEWQEPELAPQKSLTTGYPIEALPPASQARKRSGRPSQNSMRASPSVSGEESAPSRAASPPQEQKFKIKLKTNLYNELAKESAVRSSQNDQEDEEDEAESEGPPKPRRGRPPKRKSQGGESEAKRTKVKKEQESTTDTLSEAIEGRQHRSTHVKVAGKVSRYDNGQADSGLSTGGDNGGGDQSAVESSDSKEREPNQDYCAVCGGAGRFLCCETCPKSFHFSCVDPPLDEDSLPDGEWHCRECYTKKNPPLPYKKGLFSQLLNQIERRNPTRYELPKRIQEYFVGVTSNSSGEYEPELRPVKKANASDEDPLKTLDKYGDPILCYRCKKSALNGVQMLTCDFCSLYFHVDCVEPMILGVATRWKCPNHAEQAYKPPRKPRKYRVEEPTLRRGFANDGDIEIIPTEDELSERFERRIPRFFSDLYNTSDGVAAKLAPQTPYSRSFEIDGIKYRLPEEGIKLDFIDFVKQSRQQEEEQHSFSDSTSDVLKALDTLADRPQPDRKAVRDLLYLQSNGSDDAISASASANVARLLDAAFVLDNDSDEARSLVGENHKYFSTEAIQLFAIRELMQLKGKDKLLKLLLTEN
uniref:ARAD1C18634p n=1 Tax=Blastobotrys adeninivorans TaxID=409370 RepID=A0A060T0V7_BLAAD